MSSQGATERLTYGSHPSQFAELWPAAGAALRGTVLLVHGGWWRDAFNLARLEPLASRLAAAGWDVWNVEYRRSNETEVAWPGNLDDLITVGVRVRERASDGELVMVGFSAGGHLALLAAEAAGCTRAVALAPVTDPERSHREGLGEGACIPAFGGTPEEQPDAYRAASPILQPPTTMPTLIVHGGDDERVPVSHSRDYVRVVHDGGAAVDYLESTGSHFDLIDPDFRLWPVIEAWMSLPVAG